jgi:serine/threonine protein phosphatase PrpC
MMRLSVRELTAATRTFASLSSPLPKDPGASAAVLALSRAFGDSFLKESGRFEGFGEKNADYGSGFGLNAEPDCYIETVGPEDTWVCISSDGLIDNPERGGGGGFTNEDIADFLNKAPADASPESLAKELVESAVKRGSTDDITVQLIRL